MTTLRVYYKQDGGHITARLFIGPEAAQHALIGVLKMRGEDWQAFRSTMLIGLCVEFIPER